jgi:hypothetical protein
MESNNPRSGIDPASEETWEARERDWRRKLGRLRLGVEPLEEQLDRYRRVTWVLTDVSAVVALMFIGLFAAFGRPDIGGIVVLILLVPIVVLAWLDFILLARRAARFTRELQEYRKRTTNTPGRT